MSDRHLFARIVYEMMNLFDEDDEFEWPFLQLPAQIPVTSMEQPRARRRYPKEPRHRVRKLIVVQGFVVVVLLEKLRAQGNDGTVVFFKNIGEHFRNVFLSTRV